MLVFLVGSPISAFAANGGCTKLQDRLGTCATSNEVAGQVELGATKESPIADGVNTGDAFVDGPTTSVLVLPQLNLRCGEGVPLGCKVIGNPPPKATDATGPLSITDIATFRPQAPAAGMQPNQWMIVGLDTNFYANASAHVVDGTLFGGTAQVRFTPTSYNWDYGDGTTSTLGTAGTTWAKSKIAEFDPTPTSHVFEEPGNYTISLAVTYAAEYRVAGSSWQNVVGTLTIVAPPLTATAGHATTVLVDQDCIANPTGIGC
ncbi:hypothetical protein I6E68_10005 [Salinibacterium sp. NSLL150]|nr:hypothetical protein [Salinibacterium sp. NSLL35]MBH0102223.1 hypothetical protein [Salinibacterium sp. NSLL150]MBH0104983.1 hypothetical protein [Salinibacterium sp. NSLL16]MBH0107743.1 hypothetical protein [Salinibacterium sp. NSLL17]